MDNTNELFHPTPHLPTYNQAIAFISAVQGIVPEAITHLKGVIYEQVGTPQNPVNWKDPEVWIPQRLNGFDRELAYKIWRETNNLVNPRYVGGCWWLSQRYALLEANQYGLLVISSNGQNFIDYPTGQVAAEIDYKEGILTILNFVSEHTPAQRKDILPAYAEFCRTYTTFHAPYVHRTTIGNRLANLVDRGLLTHHGIIYELSEAGSIYLDQNPLVAFRTIVPDDQSQLVRLTQSISQDARAQLKDYLRVMDPYKFEHLVKLLLDEMGYSNVEVTAKAGDGGVDVIGDIELGITSVHEVVQVKRHSGNIGPGIVNQLRGTLPFFQALRGTIITLSAFTAQAKKVAFVPGGSPITLIDGEKLLDLLIQYSIGVKSNQIEYIEFDPDILDQLQNDEDEESN